jgi:hypothetical protein
MMPVNRRWILPFALLAVALIGCTSVGPKSIRAARFNYNSAIIDTRNEQLLTNLVRLRYRDPPYFLEVSSVSTQYVLGGSAGASVGSLGDNAVGGVNGAVAYEQRPTITYLPLKGDDFVDRLLSPVPMEAIVLLTHSGWRFDRVLRCCVTRVNDLWNAPTASGPTPDRAPAFDSFMETAELLEGLRQSGALELRYRRVRKGEELEIAPLGAEQERHVLKIVFKPLEGNSEETARLKELLGVRSDLDEFYLTPNPTYRESYEIGLLPRSLLGAMSYLSQAVEPPQRDVEAGRVTVTRKADGSVFEWPELTGGLFRVRSSLSPPDNAFVQVRYRDAWFYIDDADLDSKSTFNLLDQLFQLQAGDAGGAAPLLTLPLN